MTRTSEPAFTTRRDWSPTLEARFLAIISHELRTPLTTIASFTESLDDDELAPIERSTALAAVRRNTDRMLTLIDDLMVIGRLQTGDLSLAPVRTELGPLVQEAAERLAVREPHTAATLDLADGAPLVGDPRWLRELLYAVLGTVASGATDRSATVTTTPGPDGWTVTVTARQSDELTDESLMSGVLAEPEPPYRRRSIALWMLLADAIAARHGGTVTLGFEPARGAVAEIRLPLEIPTA